MRYAVYFTPAPDDELTLAAQNWLGRDAFTGKPIINEPAPGFSRKAFDAAVGEPRRYGFHATLVAPFRLRQGFAESDIAAAANAFAAGRAPFVLPALSIRRIGSFFALVPDETEEVAALASAAVDHFDALRAPLNEAEIARRQPECLTERQRAYLDRYGYPYVKDEFRFHMTLTGPLDADEAERIEPALHSRFNRLLGRPPVVEAISIFTEAEPGADFVVHSIHRLGDAENRKPA